MAFVGHMIGKSPAALSSVDCQMSVRFDLKCVLLIGVNKPVHEDNQAGNIGSKITNCVLGFIYELHVSVHMVCCWACLGQLIK